MSDVYFADKTVTTRKLHPCFGCRKWIAVGVKAQYHSGVFGGDFNSYYLCETCDDWLNDHRDYFDDGFSAGDILTAREEEVR